MPVFTVDRRASFVCFQYFGICGVVCGKYLSGMGEYAWQVDRSISVLNCGDGTICCNRSSFGDGDSDNLENRA